MSGAKGQVFLTAQQLGKALMISERRVQQLVKQGVLYKEGRGRYPFLPNVQAYIRHLRAQADKTEMAPHKTEIILEEEKARLIKAQADKAELEAARLREELIEVEQVEAMWSRLVMHLRQALLALPGRLAPQVITAQSRQEAEHMLESAIYEALTELADGEGPTPDEERPQPTSATA